MKNDTEVLNTPGNDTHISDRITINKFSICKKFHLSKYTCELTPEKRICDGKCIIALEDIHDNDSPDPTTTSD